MAKISTNRWSQQVTARRPALVLETGIFTWKNPKKIARSLQHAAMISRTRKGSPLQAAMSMLNFYINRAGKKLDKKQKKILEQAKHELRSLFK